MNSSPYLSISQLNVGNGSRLSWGISSWYFNIFHMMYFFMYFSYNIFHICFSFFHVYFSCTFVSCLLVMKIRWNFCKADVAADLEGGAAAIEGERRAGLRRGNSQDEIPVPEGFMEWIWMDSVYESIIFKMILEDELRSWTWLTCFRFQWFSMS